MLTDSPRVLSTFTKLYSQKWSHFKDIDIKVIFAFSLSSESQMQWIYLEASLKSFDRVFIS